MRADPTSNRFDVVGEGSPWLTGVGLRQALDISLLSPLENFLKTRSVRAEKVETGKLTLIPKSFGIQKVCVQPVLEVRSEGRKQQELQGSTSRL